MEIDESHETKVIAEIHEDDETKEFHLIHENNDSTRKRTMLSIEQKAEICYKLESGVSVGSIADEYHIHPTTVRGIRRNGTKVRELANQGLRMLKKKRLRKPEFEDLEDRLYDWILERRKVGKPLSDSLLHKKALEINQEFGGPSSFKASVGWLVKFKHRRDISLSEKKERAKAEARKQFATEFEFFDCHRTDHLSEDDGGSGFRKIKEEPIDYGYEQRESTDEQYEEQESIERENEETESTEQYKQEESRNEALEEKEPREKSYKQEERGKEPREQEKPREGEQCAEQDSKEKQRAEKEEKDQEKHDRNSSRKEIRHALEILTKHADDAPRFIKSTLENLKDFFLGGET